MRKWLWLLGLLLVAGTAIAQDYVRPENGLYESTDTGTINGNPAPYVPWVRIGLESSSRQVHYLWDSNNNLDLKDEVITNYYAQFYIDCVKWRESDTQFVFTWVKSLQTYRLLMTDGNNYITIDFRLIEKWM